MSNSEPLPFGGLLLRYRAAVRLTQEQLADRAGLSPDTVAALERGRRQAPHAVTVARLADATGLDERERAQLVAAAHGTGYTGTTHAIGRGRDVVEAEPGRDTARTAREVARCFSSKAIGRQLFISERTVAQHLTTIFHKLGTTTRAQAVAVATQRELL